MLSWSPPVGYPSTVMLSCADAREHAQAWLAGGRGAARTTRRTDVDLGHKRKPRPTKIRHLNAFSGLDRAGRQGYSCGLMLASVHAAAKSHRRPTGPHNASPQYSLSIVRDCKGQAQPLRHSVQAHPKACSGECTRGAQVWVRSKPTHTPREYVNCC